MPTNDGWRNIENSIEGAVERAQHAVRGVAPPGPTEITQAREFLESTGKYTPTEISRLSDFQLVEEAADEQNRQELGFESKVDPATVIRWVERAQEHDDVEAIRDYLAGTGKYGRDELERMPKNDLVGEVRDEAQRQLIGNASRLDPATLKLHLDAEQGFKDRKEVEDYVVDVGKLPRDQVEEMSREELAAWAQSTATVIDRRGWSDAGGEMLAGGGLRFGPSPGMGAGMGAGTGIGTGTGTGIGTGTGTGIGTGTGTGIGTGTDPSDPMTGGGEGSGDVDPIDDFGAVDSDDQQSGSSGATGGGGTSGETVNVVFEIATGSVQADPARDDFGEGPMVTYYRSGDGRWFNEAGNEVTDPETINALEGQYQAYQADGGEPAQGTTIATTGKTEEEAAAEQQQTEQEQEQEQEEEQEQQEEQEQEEEGDTSGGDSSGGDDSGDDEEGGGVGYTPVDDANFVDLRRIDLDPGKLRGAGGDVDPADPSFDGGVPVVGEIVDLKRLLLVDPPDPEVVGGMGRGTIPDSIQPDGGVIDPSDDAVGGPGGMGAEDDPFAGLQPGLEPSASDPVGDDPVFQAIDPSLSVLDDLDLEPTRSDSIMDFDGLDD